MAWATGSITSATPHTALSTAIKALFGGSGVVNWSFVENVPAGTGAGQSGSASYSVDVYKCMGSGTDANDCGSDFYVALQIPVTDGAVASAFHAFEVYSPISDPTNKGKGKRFCFATSTGTVPTGAGYWNADTYRTFAAADGVFATPTLNTSGFSYWIKLTRNMLVVAVKVGATESTWYAGLMDSFVVNVTDTIPLIFGNTVGSGWSGLPGSAGAVTNQWKGKATPWTIGPTLGTDNATNQNDLWQSNKIHVARVCMVSLAAIGSWYQTGGLRGMLKSDILCFKTGGTVGLGDTMVIAGNTWTVISTTASFLGGASLYYVARAN